MNAFKLAALALAVAVASTGLDARIRDIASTPRPDTAALRTVLEEGTVEGCRTCHKGPLSLASWNADDLQLRIADLAGAQGSHPVPVPSLSDEDLTMLAARLTGD